MLKINNNEIKIIISDFDGTLRDGENGEVHPKNVEIFQQLIKKGIYFVINTGNLSFEMREYAQIINPITQKNKYIISANGNIIYDYLTNEYSVKTSFTNEEIQQIIHKIKDMNLEYEVVSEDINTIYYSSQKLLEESILSFENKDPYANRQIITDEVLKNINGSPKITLKEIKPEDKERIIKIAQKEFKNIDLSITWWSIDGLDFGIGISNKYQGIITLLEILNNQNNTDWTLDNVIYFGDQHNDLSVFENLKYSIAVGNAIDELKQIAYDVTSNANQGGVADYLKKILHNNISNRD